MNQLNEQYSKLKPILSSMGQKLKQQLLILGSIVIALWLIETVDWLIGNQLDQFGIRPRQMKGLIGIFFAPFLHFGFSHLAANTLPFLILGWLVMIRRTSDFYVVTLFTMLIGGLGTWLFGGSNSVHIGASILIFGYVGYLFLRGYFEQSWQAITLSIIVATVYGGILWGVLPLESGISWQGHLFGFIGGGVGAYFLSQKSKQLQTESF